ACCLRPASVGLLGRNEKCSTSYGGFSLGMVIRDRQQHDCRIKRFWWRIQIWSPATIARLALSNQVDALLSFCASLFVACPLQSTQYGCCIQNRLHPSRTEPLVGLLDRRSISHGVGISEHSASLVSSQA